MASFSLKKQVKLTAFAEMRNQHTQVLWILRLQDLRIQELGLAATFTNTLDNEGETQGLAEASKSEAWMDSMREKLSSLINNQTWTLVNLPPGEKQYAVFGYTRLRKTNTELSTALKVAWWQKDIPRNQESTIMTLLRLSETKWFSDSFFLLPCILDTNCVSSTSTLSIYMGTWKKPYTWSNQKVLMMDQVGPQTIGKRMVISTLKFPEIYWIGNLSKRTMLAG